MDQLTFQYPIWYLLICVGLGLAYAFALYFRDKTYEDQPNWLRYFMSLLRFLAVTVLSALLLSPLLKLIKNEVQEPIIVFAQDISTSITEDKNNEDSTQFVGQMDAFLGTLSEKYNVQTIGFGSQVNAPLEWRFDDPVTDLDQVVKYISDNFGDQNLGAVILSSDGIYNRGRSPIYNSLDIKAPIYTVGLGDTTQRTDFLVQQVYHNKISFLGDKLVIQADITANNITNAGASVTLQKIDQGKAIDLDRKSIRINNDPYFETLEFTIDANAPGVQRYRIRASGVADEVSYANNSKDIFIEVIDGRLDILILADHPHPDLAALKSILELNENYSIEIAIASEFNKPLKDYSMVILHQLPGKTNNARNILAQLDENKIPRLFILGASSNLAAFNNAQSLLTVAGANRSANDVQGVLDPTFNTFTISKDLEQQIGKYVPMQAPFGQYNASPAAQVLAYQRIGSVTTEYPLILVGEDKGLKTGVIAAEGIWRWRLYDYLQFENHDRISELVGKVAQFVTVKDDKRKFRSSPAKNLFLDNEEILFEAQLYNNNYELINTPDAFLVVRDEENNESNYTFNRSGSLYEINIGRFQEGNFRYTAYVDVNGQRQSVNGRFSVQPIQLEAYDKVAKHGLLAQLSERQGGEIYYPSNLDALQDQLLTSEVIKPIMYQKVNTRSVIHLKWIFAALMLLICLEWFLRRFYGGY